MVAGGATVLAAATPAQGGWTRMPGPFARWGGPRRQRRLGTGQEEAGRLAGGATVLVARRRGPALTDPEDAMSHRVDKHWSISVDIDEHEGRTRAVARLDTGRAGHLTGVGLARLNPTDRDVPAIGDELAVARALAELSHQLFDAAAEEIESSTHEPVVRLR